MGAGVTEGAPRTAATPLLARNAEDLLWLARYIERVENLARILDVTQVFARDRSDGDQWRMVLRINADEARFLETRGQADAHTVAMFYLLDRNNPTSIPVSVSRAREIARTLRAQISTEMWLQLNVLHGWIMGLTEADIASENLSRLCAKLKEGCQAHTGITEGTFYRDQGHRFYSIGRQIERADQTTRLLDMGLRSPTGSSDDEAVRSTVLLRAAAGYHAYRRVHPAGFDAAEVADFLLLDQAFPRSVALTLGQVHRHLSVLRDRYGLGRSSSAIERAEQVLSTLTGNVEHRRGGLAVFLDGLQQEIAALHNHIAQAFFTGASAP